MTDVFYTKELLKEFGSILEVGDYTYGKPQICKWDDSTKLKIGKFCSIADGVKILLGGNHRSDWISTYPFSAISEIWPEAKDIKGHPCSKGDISIGNDVWIGMDVTILSGVTISDGAIIGAGSVVTKDVKPYSVVAGNPAKLIRMRFNSEQIEKLLSIRWWDWDIKKIHKNLNLLCSSSIDKFIMMNT